MPIFNKLLSLPSRPRAARPASLIFLLLFALLPLCLLAQTGRGRLSGTVLTADGTPAVGISVSLQGTTLGTSTDEGGKFTLSNVPTGTYALVVSSVGFLPWTQALTVRPGEETAVYPVLQERAAALQTVEITGRKETTYKNDFSFSGTKTETRVKDIPQTISTVTKELIQDQQAYRLQDVVRNVAGINRFSVYDDITMRGFRNSGSNGRLVNGLRTNNNFWQSPLLVNIERVEVIKGPASAMFSNTNPGGTVNMVTKKPLDERRMGLNFSTGSWNTYWATADFTGPLNEDKSVLYRLNVGYEDAESFRDFTPHQTLVVAPSVSFVPNDNTRMNLDLVYSQNNSVLDRGRPVKRGEQDIYATPIHLTLTQPGDFLRINDLALTLSLNQRLSQNISFNASYMKFRHNQALNEHRIQRYLAPDSIQMVFIDRLVNNYTDNLSAYFVGKFEAGRVSHQVVAGYDYINHKNRFIEQSAAGMAGGLENFSLNRPRHFKRPVSTYALGPSPWDGTNYYQTHGLYVQEQLKLGRLQALLGLRQEFYVVPADDAELAGLQRGDEQSKLLPLLGLVYALSPAINAYATYTQGYEPQSAALNLSRNAGGPFDPLTSTLLEGGAKGEFFGNRLFAGLALYQIELNNVLVSANNTENPDLLEQRGQERARGMELEATGQVLPNLSVALNYAYNRAEITQSSAASPELVGLVKENAPSHMSGSWMKYTLGSGKLAGLGFALGHSQNSARRTFARYPGEDRYLTLPSYVVFNGALYYTVEKFTLALNANNLTDKLHFIGGYNFERNFPGAPRNFLVSVGYRL